MCHGVQMIPTPEQILAGLAAIANRWWMLAALWHLCLLLFVLVLWRGRLSVRVVAILLTLPLYSVSALAWSEGNPFNGSMFLLGAIALTVLAVRRPRKTLSLTSGSTVIAAATLLIFGWVYPHFLATASAFAYLYAAPMGLLPCPTLSAVVGLTLASGGLSRAWSLVLASLAAFYGIFGAFVLGVRIDLILTAGAAVLFVLAWQPVGMRTHVGPQKD